MAKIKKWQHYGGDGLPPRNVFLNGKRLDHVLCADECRGVVRVAGFPFRLDKHKKRILFKTLRGTVRVEVKK